MHKRLLFLLLLCLLPFQVLKAEKISLSEKNPLYLDEREGKLYLFTRLNAKALTKKNAHFGIVYERGTMAKNGPFTVFVDPITFHDALTKLGLKPGDNLDENTVGTHVQGSSIHVSVIYEGKVYQLSDIIEDSGKKGFEIRFGGNKERQKRMKTGCIMCLESCYAGITSNSRYPMISNLKRFFLPNAYFRVKAPFLKGDGTFIFIFQQNQYR